MTATESCSVPPGRALPLSSLERAAGFVFGEADGAQGNGIALEIPGPSGRAGAGIARAALEAEVLEALRRPPCLVSFSGGRDSSAVLGLACAVARREGLDDPIAITKRYPGIASTEESDWQELVIGHLGLGCWERISFNQEMDLLGDVACAALSSHGLLWPPNAYLHVPLLDRARGGSLMTGLDGDGLLGNWRWLRVQQVLHHSLAPVPRDVLRVGLALAPAQLRRHRTGIDAGAAFPWLRPGVAAQVSAAMAVEAAGEPRRWDRRVAWYARRRYLAVAVHSLGLLAGARDVAIRHPLLGASFLAGLASEGGAGGLGDRSALMRVLVGDLLPEAVLTRATKAEFGRAIWRDRARAFAETWSGAGIDPALVDHDLLRSQWRTENPCSGSATLLQAAWLAGSEWAGPLGGPRDGGRQRSS